jgi:hypothetical protein
MDRLAVVAIAFAGLVHLIVAPEHYAHSPAHGIFFVISGIAEIGWAFAYWRWPSERTYYVGVSLAGALLILWGITRIVPMPFEHEIGEIDLAGLACKASELVGLLALVALATAGKVGGVAKRSFAGFLAEAVILGAFFGVGAYMVTHTVEPYMPFLGGEAHEEEEGEIEVLP